MNDRNEAVMDSLTKEIFGKLFADRGYISQKLFEKLLKKDITLVTRAKKNMKNIFDIEYSRHRSLTNFLINLVSAPATYSFLPKKPSVCSDSNMQKIFSVELTLIKISPKVVEKLLSGITLLLSVYSSYNRAFLFNFVKVAIRKIQLT